MIFSVLWSNKVNLALCKSIPHLYINLVFDCLNQNRWFTELLFHVASNSITIEIEEKIHIKYFKSYSYYIYINFWALLAAWGDNCLHSYKCIADLNGLNWLYYLCALKRLNSSARRCLGPIFLKLAKSNLLSRICQFPGIFLCFI